MNATSISCLQVLQAQFLQALPRIELHAKIQFRDVRCPAMQEDLIQEVVAIAWESFLTTSEQGKDPTTFVSVIAHFAVLHVRCHRYFCGSASSKEVHSELSQHRRGYRTVSLSNPAVWEEALRDNHRSPVDQQVIFKLDFQKWLNSLKERSQRLVEQMMLGEATAELAKRFGVSAARISQLRRSFREDWDHFCNGNTVSGEQPVVC